MSVNFKWCHIYNFEPFKNIENFNTISDTAERKHDHAIFEFSQVCLLSHFHDEKQW